MYNNAETHKSAVRIPVLHSNSILTIFFIELLKTPVPSFGRPTSSSTINSYVDYKNGKGKPEKKDLASKGKGKGKKQKEDSGEVIISIGLMFWDGIEEKLKEKRGKRLSIRVNRQSNYKSLLDSAKTKWKDYHSDLYEDGMEYNLLLEDGQEAIFLPGSRKDFFRLDKYREGILKDYKRITLFLCTTEDFNMSNAPLSDDSQDENSEAPSNKRSSNDSSDSMPPQKKAHTDANVDVISIQDSPGPSGVDYSTCPPSSSNDDRGLWFLHEEINRLYGDTSTSSPPEQSNEKIVTIDTEADVIKSLEEQVIVDGKLFLFIVIRRGATLERALTMWRRASAKVTPEHVLRVKFIGEDGIDDGALAREFLASTVVEIGKKFFPGGNPLFSTNDIQNGNYKTIGELIAVSLSQGGPPPCFLAPSVYDTLVSDVDLSSNNIEKHLTQTELEILQQIKQDVSGHVDLILEHGYTGVINNANIDSIVAAVVVSMLSRRATLLRELLKGMELFGLAATLKKHPKAARSLFVIGEQTAVDADYLFSLMRPEYSADGTSRRHVEEEVMDFFQDFVFKLESTAVTGYTEALAWKGKGALENDDDDGLTSSPDRFITADMTPAAVMGWLTGQRHRDLVEKKPIYVRFDHECHRDRGAGWAGLHVPPQ